jgi:hypothetical protein
MGMMGKESNLVDGQANDAKMSYSASTTTSIIKAVEFDSSSSSSPPSNGGGDAPNAMMKNNKRLAFLSSIQETPDEDDNHLLPPATSTPTTEFLHHQPQQQSHRNNPTPKLLPRILNSSNNSSTTNSFTSTSSSTIPSPEATAGSSSSLCLQQQDLSFEDRFKYKISMYSKVSGCRMTNIPDYTIVKQVRALILQKLAAGNPKEAVKVKFAYEKMRNGGLQIITDEKRLSDVLGELDYFAAIPCKMTFPNSPRVVGFVKDLPLNLEPAALKSEIRKELPEVYSVRYITERVGSSSNVIGGGGGGGPANNNSNMHAVFNRPGLNPSAFVSFNLRYLPGSIRVFGKEYDVQVNKAQLQH